MKEDKKRVVFLFGAGAVLNWGAPKTICKGDKLTFLPDHDAPDKITNRVCCLTHLIRGTGYKMKSGEYISDTVFKYLEKQGVKGDDLNFETVINFIDELFSHFSFSKDESNPSLYANCTLDDAIKNLFHYEASEVNPRTKRYNFSIPGFEYEKEDFVPEEISPDQKFCEFLINDMLSGIIGHVSKYSYFSPAHNVIFNEANAQVNENFYNWIKGFIDADKSIRMYTLNYDRIFKILLQEKGVEVFEGFDTNSVSTEFGDIFLPDPGRIVSDIDGHVFYNLHGCVQWSIAEENVNHLPGYLYFLTDGPTIEKYSAVLQMEKGHKILLSNIITGYQKVQKTFLSPFRQMMSSFDRDCIEAEEIFIVGYSYNDEHINDIIRNARKFNQQAKITLVNPIFDEQKFMFDFLLHWSRRNGFIYEDKGEEIVSEQYKLRAIKKTFDQFLTEFERKDTD